MTVCTKVRGMRVGPGLTGQPTWGGLGCADGRRQGALRLDTMLRGVRAGLPRTRAHWERRCDSLGSPSNLAVLGATWSPCVPTSPLLWEPAGGDIDLMSLYRIDDRELKAVPTTTFHEQGLQERRDLQKLIINQPNVLGGDMFIVDEEFENWSDSSRRIDLLAIDSDGTLAVIELKRTQDPGHMELQALRYAAMVANITFEQLTEAHQAFMEDQGLDGDAASKLDEFLIEKEIQRDDIQTAKPRIILVAPGFPPELATSVLWLNDSGLDIRCIRLILYRSDCNLFVDASQLIPLAEADDYLVQVRRRAEEVESVTRQRRPPTPNVLFNHGRIRGGEEIKLFSPYFSDSNDFDIDDSQWRAHFGPEPSARRNVNWNGTAYSLTNLSVLLRDKHSVPFPNVGFSAYWYWCLVDEPDKALAELANSLHAGSSDNKPG